jgi:hypothetical protein
MDVLHQAAPDRLDKIFHDRARETAAVLQRLARRASKAARELEEIHG